MWRVFECAARVGPGERTVRVSFGAHKTGNLDNEWRIYGAGCGCVMYAYNRTVNKYVHKSRGKSYWRMRGMRAEGERRIGTRWVWVCGVCLSQMRVVGNSVQCGISVWTSVCRLMRMMVYVWIICGYRVAKFVSWEINEMGLRDLCCILYFAV